MRRGCAAGAVDRAVRGQSSPPRSADAAGALPREVARAEELLAAVAEAHLRGSGIVVLPDGRFAARRPRRPLRRLSVAGPPRPPACAGRTVPGAGTPACEHAEPPAGPATTTQPAIFRATSDRT
ncbi:hypothetical protein [Micromonospora sp. NBC_00617]|uniref:hypothetical protein n=1 Tax=Micromonospora sp. NBC_00617 TaxID=2903587 RepID=UPI0030E072E7